MNHERMMLKGQLADAEQKREEFDALATSRLLSIRNILNPYEEDITTLSIDRAKVEMDELQKNVADIKALDSKIKKLKEALNG